MAKVLLKRTEQHYADKFEEASEIVNGAKEDDNLVTQKISEKHNKYGTYHLVDLAFNYETPGDYMKAHDGKKDNVPEGQLSIDDVEKEEEIDPDSIQFEDMSDEGETQSEQKPIEELESELPF
ncbi:hypothetical protein MTP04_24710 [Lysinibacillus sp. PLM2]|nr:hypothetical protein MTP04_24710 [Lysinibacillus sp. PLM2]